jgi:hypothetical protein
VDWDYSAKATLPLSPIHQLTAADMQTDGREQNRAWHGMAEGLKPRYGKQMDGASYFIAVHLLVPPLAEQLIPY